MYKKLAIITARSGSKGLPNKNILMLGDKELIKYTLENSIKSKVFDKIIVSTDSEEYKDICEQEGVQIFLRSKYLALDTTSSYEVIKDVLEKTSQEKYDYFVLLQPTSPFRNNIHIKEAVEKFEKNYEKYDYLVSMVESDKSKNLIVEIDDDESLKNYNIDFSNYRRQNYKEYHPNGAIFIGKCDKYIEKGHFFGQDSLSYIMDKESSLDIDDKFDFEVALTIINKQNRLKILQENIKTRIEEKKKIYKKVKNIENKIFLLGHSIIDNLGEDIKINENKVINWGIRGINSEEYNKYIFDKNIIENVSNKVILMFGTNDIVIKNWNKEKILEDIKKIISKIEIINNNCEIYFIEITKVRNRIDRKNEDIDELNYYLYNNLKRRVKWIFINDKITDKYGKLKIELTYDGLHFNEKGNELLIKEIEKELK